MGHKDWSSLITVFGTWLAVIPVHGYVSREAIDNGCEWKLVFKAISGNGRSVYDDFFNGGDMNGQLRNALDISKKVLYRDNAILGNWDRLVIPQVKLEIFSGGQRQVWFVFDGIGSTLDSWFSQDRLIASPYKTVKAGTKNYFSVGGDASEYRRFFINRTYGSVCADHCGFLAVIDPPASGGCPYDTAEAPPVFMYSTADVSDCGLYQTQGQVAYGDRLAISVKLCVVDLWID